MFETTLPFGGLFRTDTVHAPRAFDSGFRWEFYNETALNESARALFHHLDSVFRTLSAPDYMFLSSIELDAEAGRFPEVLAQYFRDDEWDYSRSYFVAPIKRVGSATRTRLVGSHSKRSRGRRFAHWRRTEGSDGEQGYESGVVRLLSLTLPK